MDPGCRCPHAVWTQAFRYIGKGFVCIARPTIQRLPFHAIHAIFCAAGKLGRALLEVCCKRALFEGFIHTQPPFKNLLYSHYSIGNLLPQATIIAIESTTNRSVNAMGRTPETKGLHNARLLKDYASWVYCTFCNQTVAYLCYTAYDLFDFTFTCQCGCEGRVHIRFPHSSPKESAQPLALIKNRFCCPNDNAPLFSLVVKNLAQYTTRVVCNHCNTSFRQSRQKN